MATDGNFANFRAVYDDLTDEVARATHQFLPDHLRNWFQTLDTTPQVSRIVQRLQESVDFQQWWLTNYIANTSGEHLIWPDDPERALGIKLLLFRQFAEDKEDISRFGFHVIGAGRNVNDNARAVVEQIFEPMARELRRYLERELSQAPAADRVVRLDHNSATYHEAIDALEKLERVLREANDYPDPEDKEQKVAEVSAARRIFQATKVRISVVVSLLAVPVTYLVKTFAGASIGEAATKVIDAITALIGPIL